MQQIDLGKIDLLVNLLCSMSKKCCQKPQTSLTAPTNIYAFTTQLLLCKSEIFTEKSRFACRETRIHLTRFSPLAFSKSWSEKKWGQKIDLHTAAQKVGRGGQLRVDRVHSHMRTFSKASTNESKKVSYVLCTAVCTVFGHWISTSCQIATIIGCFGGTSLGNPVTNSSTKSQFISEWGFLVEFFYIQCSNQKIKALFYTNQAI